MSKSSRFAGDDPPHRACPAGAALERERLEREKALALDALEIEKRLELAGRELELRRMRSQVAALETSDLAERERIQAC